MRIFLQNDDPMDSKSKMKSKSVKMRSIARHPKKKPTLTIYIKYNFINFNLIFIGLILHGIDYLFNISIKHKTIKFQVKSGVKVGENAIDPRVTPKKSQL